MKLIRKRRATAARLAVVALCVTLFNVAHALSVHQQPFTFTAIPDQDQSRLTERFGRVAAYLGRELGVEVTYIPVKNYAAAVTAFRANQVQLAWFGGLTGVLARKLVPGSQALAQGAEDRAFKSYVIAHHSTGFQPGQQFPEGIAGRSFTFGSKASTSGRLMPEFFIRQHFGKAPQQVFSRVGFSGDHSRTLALVQSGAYEVGAIDYTVWEQEFQRGLVDPGKVRVIWETPPYPDYQWTIRGDVDAVWGAGFKDKVRAALLGMKEPALLRAFPRSAFVPAHNRDYTPIEEAAVAIGLIDAR